MVREPGRRTTWLVAALALLLAGAAMPALAQPARGESAEARLAAEVAARFEVLPLSTGIVLKPLDRDAGYRVVELTATGIAVDGETVTAAELTERLGADAGLVARLAERTPEERRRLLAGRRQRGPATEEAAERAEEIVEEAAAAADEAVEEAAEAVEGTVGLPAPEPPLPPAVPEPPRRRHDRERRAVHSDARVSVGSSITIEADETARDVVVIGGSLEVDGEVIGDAVAIGGSVRVRGRVSGDAVAVGGSLELGPEAEVVGDAVSVGGRVERAPGARVVGEVSEVAIGPGINLGWLGALRAMRHMEEDDDFIPGPINRGLNAVWRIVGVAVIALFACLALLLARGPVERIGQKVAATPWHAALAGLAGAIAFVPLLIVTVVVLAISIIGIPLLILVPFAILALFLGAFVGYTGVAYRLGRWSEGRFGWKLASPYVAVLVGVALIHVWKLLGRAIDFDAGPLQFVSFLLIFAGAVFQILAVLIGFGGLLLTRFGTQPGWQPPTAAVAAPPPPPAPPAVWAESEPPAAAEPSAAPPPAEEEPPTDPYRSERET